MRGQVSGDRLQGGVVAGRIESHRDLIAWQKAMQLAATVYQLANLMPRSKEYRLTSQLLRAVASIPANIAESCAWHA